MPNADSQSTHHVSWIDCRRGSAIASGQRVNYEFKIQSSFVHCFCACSVALGADEPMTTPAPSPLQRQLQANVQGEVLVSIFDRGRYATDASIYQIMPLAVVVPRDVEDVATTIAVAREHGVPVLPRGGGTSQCGQTVNRAVVIDTSKHLNSIVRIDAEARTCEVGPGLVLDELNRALKPLGLWYPVDVSTGSRATIGGMAGNNSCGGRSIRYGLMRDNVLAIDAILADGGRATFGPLTNGNAHAPAGDLVQALRGLGERAAGEISERFPPLLRRVGGYNIDCLVPSNQPINLAHLLVGSEGTLAFSTALKLKLSPLPRNRVMGVVHFPTFHAAMAATKEIVTLAPTAVELVDRTMLDLARRIEMFRPTIEQVVRGEPDALLLVEFAEDDPDANLRRLRQLGELVGELGFSWTNAPGAVGGVVEVIDPGLQSLVTEVRKAGLNIMMSMRSEGKPVSFVEDCAVPLEDLAEYTARLTEIFERHGTRGTWYAHASVGCLHVRPVLNLKLEKDVKAMRAIAEEAFAMVRAYKGSHSGEHGDGIVRSEFHEAMFGPQMVGFFREVKQRFDPSGLFNPGKIVDPPRMDDRRLFRYAPDYRVGEITSRLDWSGWTGAGGGLQGAIEMCNNNGACRKLAGGAMCPSYRVTRNERDLTRGRANALRLAISGQLGPDALTSAEMLATMQLCVSCKACKRECPTGVDMARMKIEVLAANHARHGASLREKIVAYLPRYAFYASALAPLLNIRNTSPRLARLTEPLTGLSARRKLPAWHRHPYRPRQSDPSTHADMTVALFADTFNCAFEPDNIRAAERVLRHLGYSVEVIASPGRPPCCGRTFLAAGMIDEARSEAARLLDATRPFLARGIPVVGLEPSCLLTLRDEMTCLGLGSDARQLAEQALMLEELLARDLERGRIAAPLGRLAATAHLHTHCHQKALGVAPAVATVLRAIDALAVKEIDASCCGMAGAFGYARETYEVSMAMGELSLLPAVRATGSDDLIVADGFSCRHQVADGTGREALHVVQVLAMALERGGGTSHDQG